MASEVATPLIEKIEGWLAGVEGKGGVVIPDFFSADEVGKIRLAFDTEVPVMSLLVPRLGSELYRISAFLGSLRRRRTSGRWRRCQS